MHPATHAGSPSSTTRRAPVRGPVSPEGHLRRDAYNAGEKVILARDEDVRNAPLGRRHNRAHVRRRSPRPPRSGPRRASRRNRSRPSPSTTSRSSISARRSRSPTTACAIPRASLPSRVRATTKSDMVRAGQRRGASSDRPERGYRSIMRTGLAALALSPLTLFLLQCGSSQGTTAADGGGGGHPSARTPRATSRMAARREWPTAQPPTARSQAPTARSLRPTPAPPCKARRSASSSASTG